jgi:beta-glucanase (GH16 family)
LGVAGVILSRGSPLVAAARGPVLDRSRLRLTFAEEFDTLVASPDGSRGWRTTYSGGDRTLSSNKEAQHYVDTSLGVDPFRVEGGVLRITAEPRPGPGGLSYSSGLLTSERLFSQLYGHFEMRARLPSGRGFWPAFWLLPVERVWPPELDVVELLGHDPRTMIVSTHSAADGVRRANNIPVRVDDLSRGFHLYGASWGREEIRWYLDNVEVARAPTPADMHKPMYLLVNLAVGGPGSWPGPSDGLSTAHLLVDYVRAWRFEPADCLNQPC